MTVTDPFSHLGAGGTVEFVPNPGVALRARQNALRAFAKAFGIDLREPRADERD